MDSEETKSTESAEARNTVGEFYFYTLIAGIFSLLIFFLFSKRLLKDYKDKFYAKVLNGFKVSYNEAMNDRKVKLFEKLRDFAPPGAKLRLVEVGSGSGANFKYFPVNTRVICVDPNKHFEQYLKEEVKKLPNGVELEEFRVGYAEDMSFLETDSVDVVVCSLVLCSVRNVEQSLREIRRILKPGGKFYFIEHVAEENSVTNRLVQTLLAPLWWFLMECRLRSKARVLIENAGFSKVQVEYFNATELIKGKNGWFQVFIPLLTPHIWGHTVK